MTEHDAATRLYVAGMVVNIVGMTALLLSGFDAMQGAAETALLWTAGALVVVSAVLIGLSIKRRYGS